MRVISLGSNCYVKKILRPFTNAETLPFDWVFSNLKTIIHFLDTDKETLFARENLIGTSVVRLKSTFFKAIHDLPAESRIAFRTNDKETYEKLLEEHFISKYKRRHDRFLHILKHSDQKIVFVHLVKLPFNQSLLQSTIEKLKQHTSGPFDFICVVPSQKYVFSEMKEVLFVVGDREKGLRQVKRLLGNKVKELRKEKRLLARMSRRKK